MKFKVANWDEFYPAARAAWDKLTPEMDTDDIFDLYANFPNYAVCPTFLGSSIGTTDTDNSDDEQRQITAEALREFKRKMANDSKSLGFIFAGVCPAFIIQNRPFGLSAWRYFSIGRFEVVGQRVALNTAITYCSHRPGRKTITRYALTAVSGIVLLLSVLAISYSTLMGTVFSPLVGVADRGMEERAAEREVLVAQAELEFQQQQDARREEMSAELKRLEGVIKAIDSKYPPAMVVSPEIVGEESLQRASAQSQVYIYKAILSHDDYYIDVDQIERTNTSAEENADRVRGLGLSTAESWSKAFNEETNSLALALTIRQRSKTQVTFQMRDQRLAYIEEKVPRLETSLLASIFDENHFTSSGARASLIWSMIISGVTFIVCVWRRYTERKYMPGYNLDRFMGEGKIASRTPIDLRPWRINSVGIANECFNAGLYWYDQERGAEMFG